MNDPLQSGEEPSADARPRWSRVVITALLSVAIVGGGLAAAFALIRTRPKAERVQAEAQGLPVRVMRVAPAHHNVEVGGYGTVVAARELVVQPQVSGRIVWLHPRLVPGGRVRAGETLIRIQAQDYEAAVEQQRAQVESSQVSLAEERSRRVVAQREWALLQESNPSGSGTAAEAYSARVPGMPARTIRRPRRAPETGSEPVDPVDGRALALREPQLRASRASVAAARAGLQRARNDLRRTRIKSPFNAVVQTESLEVGQVVQPGTQLATLVGTDAFWVRVSLPVEQVASIQLPDGEHPGSTCRVWQSVGEHGRIERVGQVIRLLPDLDPVGRMARVLVSIDDPLALDTERATRSGVERLPLFLNALARVTVDAGSVDDVIELPRQVVQPGDQVYLLGDDSRLHVKPVRVVWRREQTLLVRGLTAQDRVIVSRIPTPLEGTLLRVVGETNPPGQPGATRANAAIETTKTSGTM